MPSPTLVVVTGPPGSGKTTLAHAVAAAIGCPAVCRDEIKEGMVHATAGCHPGDGRDLDLRAMAAFFETVRVLLDAGVTVVAEAAYQDRLWRPGLEPLRALATLRIIRSCTAPDLARARVARRLADSGSRAAHDDRAYLHASANQRSGGFGWIRLAVPTLPVDTSDGYRPSLPDIVAFVNSAEPAQGAPGGGE